jgi:hypothetical protein
LAVVRLELRLATTIADFDSLNGVLTRVADQSGGRRSFAVRDLSDAFIKVEYWLSEGGLGYLLAGETVRDDFDAPRLARNLFLAYADSMPTAVWAPKAILAALDLTALDSDPQGEEARPSAEELRRRLREDFEESPYVQAFYGGSGGRYTYEELEQGLRRQLERLERLADQEVRARRAADRER